MTKKEKKSVVGLRPTTSNSPVRGPNQDYGGVGVKNSNADYTISDEHIHQLNPWTPAHAPEWEKETPKLRQALAAKLAKDTDPEGKERMKKPLRKVSEGRSLAEIREMLSLVSEDDMVKNLKPIDLTGGSEARTNKLASMAAGKEATPAPVDKKKEAAAFLNKEETQLDEISKKAAMDAYQSASFIDDEHPKQDAIRAHIERKWGKEMGKHADAHAYVSNFGRGKSSLDNQDKLTGFEKTKGEDERRITKSGTMNKQDQKYNASQIKKRLGTHTKPNLPEEIEQIDELKGIKDSKLAALMYAKKATKEIAATQPSEAGNDKDVLRKLQNRTLGMDRLGKRYAKEEVEHIDEARGRPKKDSVSDSADEHPMMQARKVISTRGAHPFTFADGKKHQMNPMTAHRILSHHDNLQTPSEKEAFSSRIHKNVDSLQSWLHGKPHDEELPKISLGGSSKVGGLGDRARPTISGMKAGKKKK